MQRSPLELLGSHPVRLAYQPPANSIFLSQQTSHQQPASSILLSEQTSINHQPPANQTGCGCCEICFCVFRLVGCRRAAAHIVSIALSQSAQEEH
jgi:hypothetical protein